METINLNMIPRPTSPVCHLSQNDAGRVVRINLFDDGEVFTLGGSELVQARCMKPNGGHKTIMLTNTGADYVDMIIPEALTEAAGVVYCKLKINGIAARSFLINIESKP